MPVVTVGASQRPADLDVSRYGGADRYATSLLVAEAVAAHAGGSLEWVVMVSGRNWTDAVIAAPLAGSLGAPVLATPPGELLSDASEFLHRIGVSQALVVGAESDTEGVGPTVVAGLEAIGISVERVTRADQYATGFAVAHRMGTPGHMGNLGRTAVVASGEVFADALVAGAFAARGPHPVLLTPRSRLHQAVARYLAELRIEHVVLMGGTGALHQTVEDSIVALGIEVTRLAGSSRYDTAVEAARLISGIYGDDCFTSRRVGLARARIPFDSFSAAPLLARLCAPLLLADPGSIPPVAADFLIQARIAAASAGHKNFGVRIFGGNAAVSDAAISNYVASSTGAVNPLGADGIPVDTEAGEAQPQRPCVAPLDDEPLRLLGDVYSRQATWSPDCSRIVYLDNEGAIWTSRIDGTERTRLTAGYTEDEDDESPAWSPNGTRIAFVRYAGRSHNGEHVTRILVVNADGSGETQLTSGNFRDASPAWSPDSQRIAFARHNLESPRVPSNREDRYIAVMDADGANITALTRGGTAEASPAWSPDGSAIAYDSDGTMWIADSDGRNPRRVPVANARRSGYSWSPDGTAIAYVSREWVDDPSIEGGVGVQNGITVVSLDGHSTAHAVTYTGPSVSDTSMGTFTIVRTPRWAPDGRSILFERNTHRGDMARSYVAPVPDLAILQVTTDCRPTGSPYESVGFPRPSAYPATVGTLRVAVLFMDFPDAQAAYSTAEELARGDLATTQDFIESVSYGRLNLEFVPLRRWLRAPGSTDAYLAHDGSISEFMIAEVSASLASSDVDFDAIDAFVTVLPSNHFSGARTAGHASVGADDDRRIASAINIFLAESEGPDWGRYLVPLSLQWFGVPYLGDYGALGNPDSQVERPPLASGQRWHQLRIGTQGLSASFPSPSTDFYGDLWEPLSWTRWQLDWIGPSQMVCLNRPEATVELSPLAGSGEGTVMAAVPAAHDAIVVVESRRRIGYDSYSRPHRDAIAAGRLHPDLVGDRVLVYTVDPTLRGGRRPIKFATDNGFGFLQRYPFLAVGESLTVEGYTISVTADDGDSHTVTIVKSN
ncbi:cell wall-binding repeat-containing protein [Candidatus Poriferisodalis sp.]|uniref:cell wall-binding repeat-containing protein n=1 Tax=Candidatus Poriferisodalis sp. TaxID=3101277 RepID=UPI003AF9CCAD